MTLTIKYHILAKNLEINFTYYFFFIIIPTYRFLIIFSIKIEKVMHKCLKLKKNNFTTILLQITHYEAIQKYFRWRHIHHYAFKMQTGKINVKNNNKIYNC